MPDHSDPLAALEPGIRRDVQSIAISEGVPAETLIPEIVAAYVRLLREAPGALPRNPLAPLAAGARRRADK
ncbi:hypothetical protein [Salipiger bermudensis]|uniref:Uncharacterized protein n=1 Tax=Salipiger bermudensis (strain DSM 26914 / JCM 13377 / KCTC 12554 / HTCC2601) TaxID=314265 RepID=Q0FLK9_SALBH|nr:hypothetical protein [Salipiger bermudensis]EAU45089.1 hypothetical protein R2601_22921 [Salipiger bermudensis HTCC2601]